MSSDDFGTINVRRGERAREIEVMRQHYRQHRDALQRMAADAPTEHLASEYQRLTAEIDRSLVKLEELEGKGAAAPPPPPQNEMQRRMTHPGSRPLADHDVTSAPPTIPPEGVDEERSRLPLIIAAAVVALALIGWLIWRASSDRATPAIVEAQPDTVAADTTEAGTAIADDTIAPAGTPVSTGLTVTPDSQDFGVVRKGTRATRQYEISNTTEEPISISVARSACRCLFYEHAPVVPPKAKENLTVIVDAARAPAGELREQIRVASKADAAVGTTIDVNATIR